MLISHKRAFLARVLRGSGVLRGLELVARRPGLLVLGYHRIGIADANLFYDGVLSASAADFRQQLRNLRDRFRIVSLDEVLRAGPDLDLREPCVLITFDDGYRDNVDVALPILKELAVPATFFLPTDFLDHPQLFWWDKLAYILKRNPVEPIINEVAACLAAHPDEIANRLARLQERAAVDIPEGELARGLVMSWDDARDLRNAGMTIGSHGQSHRNLARLDEATQRDELCGSKSRLEAELGCDIRALAYPYGIATAFTESTCKIASAAGYQIAFGFGGGINRPHCCPAYALARINVGVADTPDLLRARATLLASFGSSPL